MTAPSVAILGAGMMTGVGLNAPAACTAIRCGIDNVQETRFLGRDGEGILGCEVPLEQPWRGRTKLVKLLAGPLRECLGLIPNVSPESVPLLLCLAEGGRPGRLSDLGNVVFRGLEAELGVRFGTESKLIDQGRVGGALAMREARKLLYHATGAPTHVVVAGVDSYLNWPTLRHFEERSRLLTSENSDGFIPGEAGGALLLARPERADGAAVCCFGIGFAREPAPIESEEPLRAEGLVRAIQVALGEAGLTMADIDYRIADISGEQYAFKEAALAVLRLLRRRKEELDIWHPADCIGEVGAAALPCMLGVALVAVGKAYAPGPLALCHTAGDDGTRAALVVGMGGRLHGQ